MSHRYGRASLQVPPQKIESFFTLTAVPEKEVIAQLFGPIRSPPKEGRTLVEHSDRRHPISVQSSLSPAVQFAVRDGKQKVVGGGRVTSHRQTLIGRLSILGLTGKEGYLFFPPLSALGKSSIGRTQRRLPSIRRKREHFNQPQAAPEWGREGNGLLLLQSAMATTLGMDEAAPGNYPSADPSIAHL